LDPLSLNVPSVLPNLPGGATPDLSSPASIAARTPAVSPVQQAVQARYASGFDAPQPSFGARLGSWMADTAKGYATGTANLVLDAANLTNMGANAGLWAVGASYRFRTDMHIQPGSPTEAAAQNAITAASLAVPFLGEEGLAARGAAGGLRAADEAAAARGEVRWAPSRQATAKVPSEWGAGTATKKGEGVRWTDPRNEGNGIRIDAGNPANPQTSQQVDHVLLRRNGQVIGRDGNPISGSIKDNFDQAHIPLSEWLKWSSWDHP
jgi:hypothetical protein